MRIFQIIFISLLIEKIKAEEKNEPKFVNFTKLGIKVCLMLLKFYFKNKICDKKTKNSSDMRDFKITNKIWDKTELKWKVTKFTNDLDNSTIM